MPHPAPFSSLAPLFVVFNLGSGRGSSNEIGDAVAAGCKETGRLYHLMPVDRPANLPRVAAQAVARAKAEGGIVVGAGGDGTLNAVAQETLGSGCPFGVLPRGTFNYFARTHGIPTELEQAVQVLLTSTPQPVQVGLVNQRVFLVNASLGLYPQVLQDREAWKQQYGRSRVVALGAAIATILRGHRSLKLTIDLQGRSRAVRTSTLFVGNNALQMEQVGVPEATAIDAGELAGISLRPVGKLTLLLLLARGALGRLAEAEQVENFAFSRITVAAPSALSRRRLKVATDGEIVHMKLPLTFQVAPDPLLLIRPSGPAPERKGAPEEAGEGGGT